MILNRITTIILFSLALTVGLAGVAIAVHGNAPEGIAGEVDERCGPDDRPIIQVSALDTARNEQIRIETNRGAVAEADEVEISTPGSIGGTTVTLCDKTAGLCRYASQGFVSIKRHPDKAFQVSYRLTTLDGVSRQGLILASLKPTEPKMCG